MAPTFKVAVAGITGKIGRLVAEALLSHPNVEVHGLCRSPSKVSKSLQTNPNVKIFEVAAFDAEKLRSALQGTSVCVCAYLGDKALMLDGQKVLIDACIAEGVARYIASDFSLDFRQLEPGDHPEKDAMKLVQSYLEEKEKLGQIKGVHILNGAFMEVAWSFLGIVDAVNGIFRYYGTGDERYDCTTFEDAAKFTAEVALDEHATGFKTIIGDSKSVKEMAVIFQERYNVEPKVERLGSLEDLRIKMELARNEQFDNLFAWMGMNYQYVMTNGQTSYGPSDLDAYSSINPASMAEFVQRYTREELVTAAMF